MCTYIRVNNSNHLFNDIHKDFIFAVFLYKKKRSLKKKQHF